MLNTITTASAINASSQLFDAFDMADGARLRPIHDDRSGNHRWKESHDSLNTYKFDDESQNQIKETGNHDTAAGVRKFFAHCHVFENSCFQTCHRGETSEKSE